MLEQIIHATILLPEGFLADGVCAFENGILQHIGTEPLKNAKTVIDAHGCLLLPGFIDIHCHGGNGHDFMDATPEQMTEIGQFHLKHGTTTLVATTMTDTWEAIYEALDRMEVLLEKDTTVHGVHLEGPWLNPIQCGAQDTMKMVLPNIARLQALKEKYPFIERISAAPELPGGMELGTAGAGMGLVMSIAHTDADCSEVEQAASSGYSLMTHLYSGMTLTFRKNAYRTAGAVEGGLLNDRLCVELIADGKHLPPELLRLVYKIKGPERICLITDAVRGAGLPAGTRFRLGRNQDGVDAIIEDGVAKLPDRTSFAGSIATADHLLRVMHKDGGVALEEVSKMLSETPARVMGYRDRGTIEKGKRADLVLLDGIEFVGSRRKGEVGCEAYGGWKWETFTSTLEGAIWVECRHDKTVEDQHSLWEDENGNVWQIETLEQGYLKFNRYKDHTGPKPESGYLRHKQNASNKSPIRILSAGTEISSPFFERSTGEIDFLSYAKRNQIDKIDAVYIFLGSNGLLSFDALTLSRPDYCQTLVKKGKNLVAYIKKAFPDVKVKLMAPPLHSNNGGSGFNYGAELPLCDYYDIATYKFELNKAYQAWVLEPEYSSFMEFIQLSAQFDSDYSYPSIEKPVNCRSQKTERLDINAGHPTFEGYMQIADAVYRNVVGSFCSEE